jgi:hypothetical protein
VRIRSKAFLAARDAYLRKHAPALYAPVVSFTPEQEAAIRELLAAGQEAEAQLIILNALETATEEGA